MTDAQAQDLVGQDPGLQALGMLPTFELRADVVVPTFLKGGGECGGLIAHKDWSKTSLGPIVDWPQCLRTAVSLLLRSPVPIVMLWGEDGVMLYNDAYSIFAGGRHPRLLGSKVREGWPEVADFNDHVMRVGLAGGVLHYHDQALTLHRFGRPEQVWMDLDYSPVLDEAGEPAGVICILAETTERVAAERRADFLLTLSDELRLHHTPGDIVGAAAAHLCRLLDASRVFYAEITDGTMTVERDHVSGVASIAGVHCLKAFGPDLLKAYRSGAPVVVRDVPGDERLSAPAREGLQSRQVGAFIDVVLFNEEAWVGLLAVQSGRPRIWTPAEEALVQEVGERVKVAVERARAELDLRQIKDTLELQVAERTAELARYWEVMDAITSPICAFDTDCRLIAFNRAHKDEFRRISGFDCALGDVFPDLFIPEQAVVMRALMRRALTGETFTVHEAFGRPELGIPCWEISYTPLKDEDGRIVGAFHQAQDISERLLAQAELEAAQEALRQSQKMEAMGSLTGGVAHDFNNLLTPILGSLDMLMRRGVGGERERRLIDGALQSAERAKTLVQRLLAFARRQPLQTTAVDLGELVESMADLIEATLGPTIRVRLEIEPGLPPAKADANQLEMALLNLAVNARDAMPDGGELTISAGRETDDGADFVRLGVRDTGVGMDEATRLRAIEPFFSTKGVGKGTGLGLSMVHGLAAQLGGGLSIDSAPGEGACITLRLPVTQAILSPTAAPPTAVDAAPTPGGLGLILLVEDEALVRMSAAAMLADLGYAVMEAACAQEGLDLVRQGLRPDLLVTDHLMPGMSGAQLARELLAALPGLKVLIVSGYAEAEEIDPAIARLTKPFRAEELAASLKALAPMEGLALGAVASLP